MGKSPRRTAPHDADATAGSSAPTQAQPNDQRVKRQRMPSPPWDDPAYVQRRIEALQKSMRQFEVSLERAADGDPHDLCEYLRSDAQLSEADRDGLANLIERRLSKRSRGRPKGRTLGDAQKAEYYAYVLVKKWRAEDLAQLGRSRLPRGWRDEMIKNAIECVEKLRPEVKRRVKTHNVETLLKRGRARK